MRDRPHLIHLPTPAAQSQSRLYPCLLNEWTILVGCCFSGSGCDCFFLCANSAQNASLTREGQTWRSMKVVSLAGTEDWSTLFHVRTPLFLRRSSQKTTLEEELYWVKVTDSWSVANRMSSTEGSWVMSSRDILIFSA